MLNIALASNEPRSQYFFDSLRKNTNVLVELDFDHIDLLTKYFAAALSFKLPRSEWWGNYQMHPLIQGKRRKNLLTGLLPHIKNLDAVLMWGSWFHPFKNTNIKIPFYVYIDQSRSLIPTSDEPASSTTGRKKSYELQVETYKECAGIFCMSEWAKKQTLESHSYLSEEKVHVLGWGPCSVDLSDEEPSFNRKPLVLHISNDFNRKGIDYLFNVASELNKQGKDIKFVVIGEDASYKHDILPPPNVEFKGRIYDKAILKEYFRQASVFFLPHRFDRNPHVLVEAMSAGVPLVASSQGGAIEVIQDKGTGFLCPIGDTEAYSNAIKTIIENPLLLESMGRKGYDLVKNFYNWDIIAEKAVNLMRNS